MKKGCLVLIFVVLAGGFFSIQFVRNGSQEKTPNQATQNDTYPKKTIGEAFDDFTETANRKLVKHQKILESKLNALQDNYPEKINWVRKQTEKISLNVNDADLAKEIKRKLTSDTDPNLSIKHDSGTITISY